MISYPANGRNQQSRRMKMNTMQPPDFYQIAQESIGQYLTMQDWGTKLVVFPDADEPGGYGWDFVPSGTVSTTAVAAATCPGIGNLDSSDFTEGFAEYDEETDAYVTTDDYGQSPGRVIGDLAAVILECVRDGDVIRFTDDLEEKLKEDYQNQTTEA